MGRQWNTIIESLGPLTGGSMSISANLTDIEALLTTLQADVADGISVTGSVDANITNNPVYTDANITNSIINADNNTLVANQSIKVGWTDTDNAIFRTTTIYDPFPVRTIGTVSITNGTVSITNGTVSITNGTVTPKTSTSGGTGPTTFTSTTYGTIATSSTARLGCTIFNEGPGNLHVMLGTATASTSSYTARLSSGDYYEVPFSYTGLIGGIFATAGTARVTQIS